MECSAGSVKTALPGASSGLPLAGLVAGASVSPCREANLGDLRGRATRNKSINNN